MEKLNIDILKSCDEKKPQEKKLKTYATPYLRKLGAMQNYTLGGSVGTGDSGGASTTEKSVDDWGGW